MDFKRAMEAEEYDFLRTNPRLGRNIILLGVGGSYAYGTDNENSDIDFRGITLNQPSDLLGLTVFEQYEDNKTDTVVYAFNKAVKLLLDCNPNMLEILGLDYDKYLIMNDIGHELLDNRKMFLSKRAIYSFGGYASAQLRRLQNAVARDSLPQAEREQHIYNTVMNILNDLNRKGQMWENGDMRVYIDRSDNPEFDKEIFIDVNCSHLSLRDYSNVIGTMSNAVRSYDKIGKRNKKKDDNHLNKHAMHLIRLFMMAIDILEKAEIIDYRGNDLELLLSIRRGDYLSPDRTFKQEFYDILAYYESRLKEAESRTILPDNPDMERVERFVEYVNRRAVEGNY